MKRLFLLLFLMFVSISCAQEKQQEESGPKIYAADPVVDLGNINEGDKITHKFIIENKGISNLEITRVRASCGCTGASPSKDKLVPGETAEVSVTFNSKGRSGKQRKHVYVFTNDPETPQLRLTFSTNIISKKVDQAVVENAPRLDLAFNQYNFKDVKKGTIAEGSLAFRNNGKSDLEIENIESTCDCIKAETTSKKLKPGEKAEINIKFDTTDRVGTISRTLVVKSNDPVTPKQAITIFINIES